MAECELFKQCPFADEHRPADGCGIVCSHHKASAPGIQRSGTRGYVGPRQPAQQGRSPFEGQEALASIEALSSVMSRLDSASDALASHYGRLLSRWGSGLEAPGSPGSPGDGRRALSTLPGPEGSR